MSSNNPVQNITNYVSGSHRFINVGTGSGATPTNTLVTLAKRTVMTIESCNIGIGTTIPRATLDVIGNTYISQNLGIGTTIIGAYGLNVVGNVYSSGTITATNYIGESATFSGTLLTSNLIILGSNTVINTYTQQSSNFSVCNVIGTGPALSVIQKGIGAGYPIADFYDLDVSTTVPALRIADGGNVGIGTDTPVSALHVQGNIYSSANIGVGTSIIRQALDVVGDTIVSGNIGIGTTLPSALIQVDAGTTTVAPFLFTSGTNLTTVASGAIEYDGENFYGTVDTTSGRGYFPSCQLFRLAADRTAIGSAIANYFGTTSAINLKAGGLYDLEANCYFVKQTAGTITVTFTTSVSAVYVVGCILYNNSTATGARSINKVSGGATANAFTASQSLTTGGSNTFNIRASISANATTNGTLTINFTESAGTIVPLKGSYYKVMQAPSANTGIFS